MTSRTTPLRSVRICSFCASERVSQNRRGSMDMLRIHGPWRSGPRRIAHVASCVGYVHPPSAKGPREGAEAERHPGRTPGHTNLEPWPKRTEGHAEPATIERVAGLLDGHLLRVPRWVVEGGIQVFDLSSAGVTRTRGLVEARPRPASERHQRSQDWRCSAIPVRFGLSTLPACRTSRTISMGWL